MTDITTQIEALIFAAEQPISLEEIKSILTKANALELNDEQLQSSIDILVEKYKSSIYPFEILGIAEGYQFLTKPEYQPTVALLVEQKNKRRLTNAALETLAIIAYRQPVSKGEIEKIRGVNCDYTVEKLLEKELIVMVGRSETEIGKPMLYGTSKSFMEYFGISSVNELPKLKDIPHQGENEIGGASPVDKLVNDAHSNEVQMN